MAEKPNDTYAASLTQSNDGAKSVLILTADKTQDLEFFYPYYRFVEEGFQVDVATPKGGAFEGKKGMGLQETKAIADIDPRRYDLLYIPGGQAPEALKKTPGAVELVKRFAETKRPIAAICHGAQLLAAAGIIRGRNIAAWPDVEQEVREAGANYKNAPTVVDGQFITARWPGDLPMHVSHTLKALYSGQVRAA